MINGLKSIAKQRAAIEAESILMESVLENQEVADLFLAESGEATIGDIYSDEDVDIPDDAEIDALIDNLPESDIDDDEILDKMLSSDDVDIDDIFEACGEKNL